MWELYKNYILYSHAPYTIQISAYIMQWEGIVEAAILEETMDTNLIILFTIPSILKMMPNLERERESERGRGRGRERERERERARERERDER